MSELRNPEGAGPPPHAVSIAQHVDLLFAYAYRLTSDEQTAEDLTQQTFLIAQQRLHQLREADKLSAWLLRILRNQFLKGKRRTQPIAASQLELDVDAMVPCPQTPEPWDSEAIQLAVARLPEDYRIVILMHYFESLSYREIADELQLPIGTVMSRLARARAGLRRMLPSPESQLL